MTKKLLLLIVLFFGLASAALNFKFATSGALDIRGVEPNVVYSIETSLLGLPLYRDVMSPPYAVTQYSPLYYLLYEAAARALSLEPGPQYADILTLGRLLSFGALLALSALVFRFTQRLGADRVTACLSAVLVLNLSTPWFVLARPDALCAFFAVGGLASLVCASSAPSGGMKAFVFAAVGGACCWLSLLTKQTGVIFILTGAVMALLMDRKRLATGYISGLVLAALISFLVATLGFGVTRADMLLFYRNAFGGVQNGISLEMAYIKVYDLALTRYAIFFAFPIACMAAIASQRDQASPPLKMLLVAFGFSLSFGLVTAIKNGSAIHYLNEPMIIGLLLTVATLANAPVMQINVTGNRFLSTLALLSVGLFLTGNLFGQFWQYRKVLETPRQAVSDEQLIERLGSELEKDENSRFLVESGSRLATLRYPNRVVIPHPDITTIVEHTPVVAAAQAQMIKSGELRYIVRALGGPETPMDGAYRVLLRGKEQEILVNTCAFMASPPVSTRIYSEPEFRNLSIEFVERFRDNGRWFARLRIHNANAFPISATSATQNIIQIGWRIVDGPSTVDVWNARTELPCHITAGGSIEATIPVGEVTGQHPQLQLDLVQEGVFWRQSLGVPPLSVPWPPI